MKFTNEVFKDFTNGAEFYRHKGSLWLIFTDQKKWVFELSKEGVLWYNYYFFDKIFKFFSMDLIENQKFITEWVEDTIQNGVKHTASAPNSAFARVEYTIQNGVKHTDGCQIGTSTSIEDTIQNGVKETNPHFLDIINPINFEPAIKEMKRMNEVHIILENGIKEVKELPDKSGELRGYGEYYQSQEDRTKPHTQYVNDVLKDGINETNWRCVDNHPTFVDNVLTSGIKEIWGYAQQPKIRVDEVIQSGVQEDLS